MFGSRWNSVGKSVIYVAGSISLATLEMLVHLNNEQLLHKYVIARVDFDESLVTDLTPGQLPRIWRDSPSPDDNKMVGDAWVLSGESVALRVPSAVIDHEYNYLLNPSHANFSMVALGEPEDLQFDRRLKR